MRASPNRPAHRMVLAGAATAIACLALAFLGFEADVSATETPEEALSSECKKLREEVMNRDGFLDRIAAYRDAANTFQELRETLDSLGPILEEAAQLRDLEGLGLLDLMADLEPSLAFIPSSLEVISKANEVFKEVDTSSKSLMVTASDVERLLRKESLTVEEIQAIRSAIPEGQAAIRRLASRYQAVRPGFEQGLAQLDEARLQLGAALQTGGLFGIGDFSAEVDALFGEVLGQVQAFKGALDALAENSEADIEALDALQKGLVIAQAHHAFAIAQTQRAAGDLEEAKKALELLVAAYPGTEWATQAQKQLEAGLYDNQLSTEPSSGGLGLLLGAVGTLLAAALAFVLWSRRKEMQS